MSEVPATMPDTRPVALMDATLGALELHVTAVFVPGSAVTVATSSVVVPGLMPTLRWAIAMEMGRAVMVIVAVARRVESAVDAAVMVALPSATAVTKPFALTVAIAALLELQFTVSARPPSAETVAVSCCVPEMNRAAVVGDTATARTTGCTVIVALPRNVVSATETAVIVVVPTPTPVTTPVADTVAMVGAAVRHVTAVLDPTGICTVATSVVD